MRRELGIVISGILVGLLHGTAAAWSNDPVCALPPQPVPQGEPRLKAPLCEQRRRGAPIPWTKPVTAADAKRSWRVASEALEAGRAAQALLQLRVVRFALPELDDVVSLYEGRAYLLLGQPQEAYHAFDRASESPNLAIAADARVQRVKALLRSSDRHAEAALQRLLRLYPDLPHTHALHFELGRHRERRGNRWGAVAVYRSLDIEVPWTEVGAAARERLEALAEAGVPVRSLTVEERLRRAERVVRRGTPELARQVVDALLEDQRIAGAQRQRVYLLAARVARVEGRFAEAQRWTERAQGRATRASAKPAKEAQAARERERELAERRIRGITRGRPFARLPNPKLRLVLDVALGAGLRDAADAALEVIAGRHKLYPAARFDAALSAVGTASDTQVAKVLATLFGVRRYEAAAHYHYARAMERLGRFGEAEGHYWHARDADRSRTQYYVMWTDLRLWQLQNQALSACLPPGEAEGEAGGAPVPARADGAQRLAQAQAETGQEGRDWQGALQAKVDDAQAKRVQATLWSSGSAPLDLVSSLFQPSRPRIAAGRATRSEGAREAVSGRTSDDAVLVHELRPIAERHGDVFPWLERAMALIQLGERERAADELNEAYLAWHNARGGLRLRSGLEALYRGGAPPRRPDFFKLRRARLSLSQHDREVIAAVGEALGDPGVATRFRGWDAIKARPRAYADVVERVARKYRLDPNLLFAVMRVESIYNRRIISHAGAVGLMQIMPRTGELIARQLGRTDFVTTELLDPETNLEFAAWYLSSLLDRFEGRLPLAIASYNGGPHNVRAWIHRHGSQMPLDAFLEHIPFSQTHRYVRRVLTHYAAYRAQQGLPMTHLRVDLPAPKPDAVAF